jgi:hypothetical protein
MNYALFRNTVLEWVEAEGDWSVDTDWGENAGDYPGEAPASADKSLLEDFIELEQERGAFYEFMTISVNRLFYAYREEGWDAVRRDLERFLRRESKTVERKRGIDYEARLDREGVELYRKLRALRAEIAARRRVPPYIVFMNRSLYEMCVNRPGTIEEMQNLYGVGKKNSADYGEEFLEVIHKYSSGEDPAIADQTAPSAAPLSVAEELSHFAVSKATG